MIKLGKDGELNLEKLIATRLLINANSGGGKSWAIRRLLEQSHGKVQQIIIDLEGEFATLREEFDYLLVGKDGEIPTSIRTAELLARKLLELNVSTIIDLSELKHPERITFVKRFLDSLINSPKELWHPLLVVIDEAHIFCPESTKSESASAVIDLATRGRKRGFCAVLATQRISKLNKDAIAELNNYMTGRTGLDIDMKRAGEILGFSSKEDIRNLRELKSGEFDCFGPAFNHDGVKRIMVGEIKTTHQDRTKGILIKEVTKTPENIKKLLKDVIDLPKEAEKELKNIEDYKNEVFRLKKELTLTKKGVSPQQVKVAHQDLEKSRSFGFKEAEQKYIPILQNYKKIIDSLKSIIHDFTVKSSNLLQIEVPKSDSDAIKKINPMIKPISVTNLKLKVTNQSQISYDSDTKLGKCEKMIYSFLYNNPERSFNTSQIGAVTGYSSSSGGFNNALSKLRSLNLIRGTSSNLQVNEMNPEIVIDGTFEKENIINILGKCEKEIYNVLLDNPNREFSKEDLASETPSNYSSNSGGFNNSIARLKTLGLIKRENSIIKLNPDLLEI